MDVGKPSSYAPSVFAQVILFSIDNMSSSSNLKPLAGTALFSPVSIGAFKLQHRIIQAPLTRMRGVKESDGVFVPGDLHVEHYSQRASKGGLLLTEATSITRRVCTAFPLPIVHD